MLIVINLKIYGHTDVTKRVLWTIISDSLDLANTQATITIKRKTSFVTSPFSVIVFKCPKERITQAFGTMKVVKCPFQKRNNFTSPHTTHSPCELALLQ